jgi:hypothetical protein
MPRAVALRTIVDHYKALIHQVILPAVSFLLVLLSQMQKQGFVPLTSLPGLRTLLRMEMGPVVPLRLFRCKVTLPQSHFLSCERSSTVILGNATKCKTTSLAIMRSLRLCSQVLTARPLILLALVSGVLVSIHFYHEYQVDFPVGVNVEDKPETTNFRYHNGTIRNLRLAFIGDSLSRYQYIDLVLYLHTGQWPQLSDARSPVWIKDFRDFHDFFIETSDVMLEGTEFCDCFRTNPVDIRRVFENRYYADHGNYVALITRFGSQPSQGHGDPATVFEEDLLSAPLNDTLYEFVAPDWVYNWSEVILNHVALFQPKLDYVVINAGRWRDHGLTEEVLREIRAATDKIGITAIYKTTTKGASDTDPMLWPHDVLGCAIFDYCLDLSWTSNTTVDCYMDNGHFQAPVYQQMNMQLMELLAGLNQTA